MANNRNRFSLRRWLVLPLLLVLVLAKWPDVVNQFTTKLPDSPAIPPKSISAEDVLEQINSIRTGNKMLAVKRSEKLDRAALSRLRVVINDGDFSGEKTGVSLANAVKNNGYFYNLIGDLYIEGISGETDVADWWLNETETKKRLNDSRFRDIGLAIDRRGSVWSVMVILGRSSTVSTEKIGVGGYPDVAWGGPELWEAINKRRVESGVNPLTRRDEICTIASIRLNQLLALSKLDGHAGFEPLLSRDDLKWIREKYTLSEFLIVGYPTPAEAVNAWEHTLGHKALLAGGEYVWGCVYAQNTFGVAITAY